MIEGYSITVVMPCRNEERAIVDILRTMPDVIDEVIVVDNNSTDSTAAVAASHGAKVLNEPRTDKGIGYGYALQSGIDAATSDVVFTMDADGTYPIHRIQSLITEMLAREKDFISCCRLPRQETEEKLWVRIAGVKILNGVLSLLYNYSVQDCLSGMMIMRRDKFAHCKFEEGGWNFSLELKLVALVDPDIRFAEIHIPYHDRILNQSKQQIFVTGFEHLLYLFRFRFTHPKRRLMKSAQYVEAA